MRVHLSRHSAVRLGAASSVMALAIAGLTITTSAASDDARSGLSKAENQPTLVSQGEGDKAPSSALAKTPPGLRTISSGKLINVMIKYDYDSVASYKGTVRGLAATSPSVTKKSLTRSTGAKTQYLGYVRTREAAISNRISSAVPRATITRSFRVVYGGVAAVIPGNSVNKILRQPGVVAVQRDATNQPLTDSSGAFINTGAAYHKLNTKKNAGQGILLGNLDTGVWPEHPSFQDQGNLPAYTGPALPCDYGDNPLTPANDPFVCNNKLVGGRAFLDTYEFAHGDDYMYPGLARDAEGHGSHTAATSAGNIVNNVHTLGPVISQISGMAPGAQVMEYRVCGPLGCVVSDSVSAVQQAILDGVDVINFSISGGTSPMTDPVELAFLDAYAAGVFVSTSAGNDGPAAGTANHLSPWVVSTAASTQKREFASTLTLTDGAATFTTEGASITAGAGPLPVVLASAAPYSSALCLNPAPPGIFTGKIVVCARGVNARVDKGFNVLQGGAAGMILYNPVLADVETDNHWLPAVHLADGTNLLAFLSAHPSAMASFTAGAAKQGQGDVMAAFSSRGPAGAFVKPDITAPGVQILAAMTPTPDSITGGPPGQYYQSIAGTSMSSPHIAGAAILIKAVHPDWTPGQIKSAMMTQSLTSVVKEDTVTPADPFDMGAGRIDVGRALKAPLTISETAARFAAFTGDPLHQIDLNIPSINAPTMPGRVTTVRTVKNTTGAPLTVTAKATAPAGSKITFSPTSLTLPVGGIGSFNITIDSTAPVGEQQFATVKFNTAKGNLHLPVAFVPRQGSVSLVQSCADATIDLHNSTTCSVTAQNNSFVSQDVDLTTSVNNKLSVVNASGATVSLGQAHASATLGPATLGVPSVDPGSLFGYIPLEAFGIAPTPISDEEYANYNVPAFQYNGQAENRIGIDSNGYLVVGGITSSEDNNCCNLPPGASPDRPNNILAPFWSDLDGTGAPGIRIATLTDGVDTWLVVQWNVRVFGTAPVQTFQTWIGVNGTQDISFAYDPGALPNPFGQDFLVGAENAAGQGDVTPTLPTGDLVVTSTDPAPGDSYTYSVTVRGEKRGAGNVHTDMDASGVSGTTTANTPVTVVR